MKITKMLVLFIVISGLIFVTGVAQAEQKSGGTLEVATPDTIVTLDWQGTTDSTLRQVGWHIWEGLVCYNEKFEIIPQLAESYEVTDNNTVYTFKLRKGVQFQKGYGELTAADVKTSLDRFFIDGVRKSDFKNVDNLEVIDDYTIKITLKNPSGIFLPLLATPLGFAAIMPKDLAKIPIRELEIDQVVGTGPFELEQWLPREMYVYKKFKDYTPNNAFDGPSGMGGKRTAYFDTINVHIVADENTRISGLRTGQYDFIMLPPNIEFKTLKDDDRFGVQDKATLVKDFDSFNITKTPTDSVAFRRAVVMALNMDEIMSTQMMGVKDLYRLDSSIFAKESPWWYPAGEIAVVYNKNENEVHLDSVKKLLELADYQGEEFIIIASSKAVEPSALVMQQQLKKVGINAKVETYDWATAVNRREQGEWNLFMGGATQSVFDPSSMRLFYYGDTAKTIWNYSNPMLDAMIDEQATYLEVDRRMEAYKSIQLFIWNDLPGFITGDEFRWNAYSNNLKGNLGNWYLSRFWDVWKE